MHVVVVACAGVFLHASASATPERVCYCPCQSIQSSVCATVRARAIAEGVCVCAAVRARAFGRRVCDCPCQSSCSRVCAWVRARVEGGALQPEETSSLCSIVKVATDTWRVVQMYTQNVIMNSRHNCFRPEAAKRRPTLLFGAGTAEMAGVSPKYDVAAGV